MSKFKDRLKYLFTTTKGLILMAIAFIGIIAAVWGTLSGPLAEIGVKDITIDLLNMDMIEKEREGRLVMMYHSIAMIVCAICAYLITSHVPMKKGYKTLINNLATFSYMIIMVFGFGFAYWGHNWTFHAVYVAGMSLMYFVGILLAIALWPWNKDYYLEPGSEYSHLKSGFDMERAAFFTVVVATLGSAAVGAWAGAYFSNGFEAFLAEDTIRYPFKTYQMKAIVGHLHIMLALIGIVVTLVFGRWYDMKGIWHKLSMPSMIVGSIVLTTGSLSVIWTEAAHVIVYAGAVFSMLGGLFLVIYGLPKITRERLDEQGIKKPTFWQGLMALFHDPLKFGILWQMIFMNFNVSGIGIFMAVRLEEIFRIWPHRDERIELSGHWHILSAIIAVLVLSYVADRMGVKGKVRQWTGWLLIIGSNVAFAAATQYEMKRLYVSEFMQQSVTNTLMLLMDFGLITIMILLAAFLVWRLIDLFKADGKWSVELKEDSFAASIITDFKDKSMITDVEIAIDQGVSQ
ncbi:MAG: hypothetical protein WDA53_04335 [Bacillota bacterium]